MSDPRTTGTLVAPTGPSNSFDEDDADWFGEGTSFDSCDDLAAALFALAGVKVETFVEPHMDMPAPPDIQAGLRPAILSVDRTSFKVYEAPRQDPSKWRVRGQSQAANHGPNRWGIRHGVNTLKRTEQMMSRLQRDAVEVAFAAAVATLTNAELRRR